MTNILEAIYNIFQHQDRELRTEYTGSNRANSMGDSLEKYIKDAFACTADIQDESAKLTTYQEHFSWLGTQNNPPDIMIKEGDAIEVKKIESAHSTLALNSSYPKAYLRADSPMITRSCRSCEDWSVKDIIYCVGHVANKYLKSLWMVYGSIYAAEQDIYERIKSTISSGIIEIPDVVFSETKELGRVNQVDPLGITNLRIRGMWQIENPRKVFDYLYTSQGQELFELICVIPSDKYNRFPVESRLKIEHIQGGNFSITDVRIKNPNNPVQLVDGKLIKFVIVDV